VTVNGELGGGVYSRQLFGSFDGNTAKTINGYVGFEDIAFASSRATGSGSRDSGGAINSVQSAETNLRIVNCTFDDFRANGSGGAVYAQGGDVTVSGSGFTNIRSTGTGGVICVQGGSVNINHSNFSHCSSSSASGGILYFYGINTAEISNVTIDSVSVGGAVYNNGDSLAITDTEITNVTGTYGIYSFGGFEANNVKLRDIHGTGIYVTGGFLYLSAVDADRISGRSVYFDSSADRAIIEKSRFNDCGDVHLDNASSVRITDLELTDIISGASALHAVSAGGNIDIDNVKIENVVVFSNVIFILSVGIVVSDVSIKNMKSTGGLNDCGIYLLGSRMAFLSGILIEHANVLAGIISSNNFKIENSVIKNVTGDGIYCFRGLEAENLELRDIKGHGIHAPNTVGGGALNLSGITATDLGGAVRFNSSANRVVIKNSSFDRCGSVYLEDSSSVEITNLEITNNRYASGLIAISSTNGNIDIEKIKIENVSGDGIYISTAGTVIISDANVKNIDAVVIESGIRLYSRGGGTAVLSGITVEHLYSEFYNEIGKILPDDWICSGIYSNMNLILKDAVIKNVKGHGIYSIKELEAENLELRDITRIGIYHLDALNLSGITATDLGGSAVYYARGYIPLDRIVIENSSFNRCGGIESMGNMIIEDSYFINVSGIISNKNNYQLGSTIIRHCTFIHDSNYAGPEVPSTNSETGFFNNTGVFEDCTFTNLRSNKTGRNFLFNRWSTYPGSGSSGGGVTGSYEGNLTLKNCTFNLGTGSAGIMALYGGQRDVVNGGIYMRADELLMEGCTINYSGGQTPVIWFTTSPQGSTQSGTFRIRQNNKFWSAETGEITINNAAQIANLTSRGIVLLENGAMPVLIP